MPKSSRSHKIELRSKKALSKPPRPFITSAFSKTTLDSNAGDIHDDPKSNPINAYVASEASVSKSLDSSEDFEKAIKKILSNINTSEASDSSSPTNIDVSVVSNSKGSEVSRWMIFSVLFALLPVILVASSLPLHGIPVTFENTLSHGELLLVSTAILGEAIGDLFLRKMNIYLKISIGGLDVLVFGLACFFFADIIRSDAVNAGKDINHSVNELYSYSVIIWTVLSGLAVKILGEN